MDKLIYYEQCILKVLENHAHQPLADAQEVELQVIADKEHQHYQLMMVGWRNDEFIHSCLFHFDIKQDKVWL